MYSSYKHEDGTWLGKSVEYTKRVEVVVRIVLKHRFPCVLVRTVRPVVVHWCAGSMPVIQNIRISYGRM